MCKLLPLFLAAFSVACSNVATHQDPCNSLACIAETEKQQLRKTCRHDLFQYPRKRRTAIDAEYRYPLTNHDTYAAWRRMGRTGPAPYEWCKKYAEHKFRVSFGAKHRG